MSEYGSECGVWGWVDGGERGCVWEEVREVVCGRKVVDRLRVG